MKTTIQVSKSFISNGKIQGAEFEIKIHTPLQNFLKSRISDAELLANINGGQVYIVNEKNSLYINYLDVPNTNKIDQLYKF